MAPIKKKKVSELSVETNTTGFYIFGYNENRPPADRSVRFPFASITNLFGVSQVPGQSITEAPSLKLFADTTRPASAENAGLQSIDHYKSVEDMITNFTALVESQNLIKAELKRIADKQTETYADEILIRTGAATEIFTPFVFRSKLATQLLAIAGDVVTTRNIVANTLTNVSIITPVKAMLRLQANQAETLNVTTLLPKIERMQLKSPTLTNLRANSLGDTFKEIDVSACPSLKVIVGTGNISLTTIDVTQNPELTELYLYGSKITGTLDISKNTKLVTVPIYNNAGLNNLTLATSYPDLVRFSVQSTAIPLTKIMEMGAAWGSRTGKTAGALDLSLSVYNTMTDEQKAVFANKNINITAS